MSRISSSTSNRPRSAEDDGAGDGNVHVALEGVDLVFPPRVRDRSLKTALVGRRRAAPAEGSCALRGVDLAVAKGDRLGVVGTNGSGKTSLLQVMAGIYPPTAGRVRRRGSLVPLLQLGLGFNPELSGRENILLAAALLGIPRREIEPRIEGILDFCDLHRVAEMPIKYYSTGMNSRLAFAVATEIDPEILLLDEVFAVGDIHWIERAVKRLENLLERVPIAVLVSHSLEIIERLANRCVLLERGRVTADGGVSEVLRRYRDAPHPDGAQ